LDPSSPPRYIAGFPAELRAIDLSVESESGARIEAAPTEIYVVADLERYVDGARLLRDPLGTEPPYWALVWIGARAIAARLQRRSDLSGRRVLDLGCGLGLSGIVAGVSGSIVTFADYVAEATEFARANAEYHRLDGYSVRQIDFTSDRLGERFDLILAADIVYDPAHYVALVTFLGDHLEENGTILLTESLRADAKQVIEMLAQAGFRDEVEAVWVWEDGKRERTWLHTLTRVSPGAAGGCR
jgi:predicted nicotinamide N-methyase